MGIAPARSLAVAKGFAAGWKYCSTVPRRPNTTAAYAARLKSAASRLAGIKLHIAAHARSEGWTLVTNNLREFERVQALQLVNWLA